MSNADQRHFALSVVEGYLANGVEGSLEVEGQPEARLTIDPHRSVLGVQVPATGPTPELTDFANLTFDEIDHGGSMWHQMTVRVDDNVEEVYALLCAILDRVQVAGQDFGPAVTEALDSFTGIVAVRRGLSHERRVGLFGELLVLLALVGDLGPATAVAAWRGPAAEEHDFGLVDVDLEVKTTLGERREHWISTATQLAPTGDRPLYLVSVQLTAAGLGAGWNLPSLVDAVRSASAGDKPFEVGLQRAGYRDVDADLYRSQWALRTSPAFFEVDERFPALTESRLEMAVPSAQRITDIRYRVDLSGMAPSPAVLTFDAASSGASK